MGHWDPSERHSWSGGGGGTAWSMPGLEDRLFLQLVPLTPVLLPQSQTRPQEKAHPVSFSRQTMQVSAGRCFLFLETPSGAFSFKSFSLSMRKLLLEVAIIHSMSHFNIRRTLALWSEGESTKWECLVWSLLNSSALLRAGPQHPFSCSRIMGAQRPAQRQGISTLGNQRDVREPPWTKSTPSTAPAITQPRAAEL